MAHNPAAGPLLEILHTTIVDIVQRDARDLTTRQLAVFLICYLDKECTNTVRGLAQELNVPKSAITRALNRLEEVKLARRNADPEDRRSVVVAFTPAGKAIMNGLRRTMAAKAEEAAVLAEQQAA